MPSPNERQEALRRKLHSKLADNNDRKLRGFFFPGTQKSIFKPQDTKEAAVHTLLRALQSHAKRYYSEENLRSETTMAALAEELAEIQQIAWAIKGAPRHYEALAEYFLKHCRQGQEVMDGYHPSEDWLHPLKEVIAGKPVGPDHKAYMKTMPTEVDFCRFFRKSTYWVLPAMVLREGAYAVKESELETSVEHHIPLPTAVQAKYRVVRVHAVVKEASDQLTVAIDHVREILKYFTALEPTQLYQDAFVKRYLGVLWTAFFVFKSFVENAMTSLYKLHAFTKSWALMHDLKNKAILMRMDSLVVKDLLENEPQEILTELRSMEADLQDLIKLFHKGQLDVAKEAAWNFMTLHGTVQECIQSLCYKLALDPKKLAAGKGREGPSLDKYLCTYLALLKAQHQVFTEDAYFAGVASKSILTLVSMLVYLREAFSEMVKKSQKKRVEFQLHGGNGQSVTVVALDEHTPDKITALMKILHDKSVQRGEMDPDLENFFLELSSEESFLVKKNFPMASLLACIGVDKNLAYAEEILAELEAEEKEKNNHQSRKAKKKKNAQTGQKEVSVQLHLDVDSKSSEHTMPQSIPESITKIGETPMTSESERREAIKRRLSKKSQVKSEEKLKSTLTESVENFYQCLYKDVLHLESKKNEADAVRALDSALQARSERYHSFEALRSTDLRALLEEFLEIQHIALNIKKAPPKYYQALMVTFLGYYNIEQKWMAQDSKSLESLSQFFKEDQKKQVGHGDSEEKRQAKRVDETWMWAPAKYQGSEHALMDENYEFHAALGSALKNKKKEDSINKFQDFEMFDTRAVCHWMRSLVSKVTFPMALKAGADTAFVDLEERLGSKVQRPIWDPEHLLMKQTMDGMDQGIACVLKILQYFRQRLGAEPSAERVVLLRHDWNTCYAFIALVMNASSELYDFHAFYNQNTHTYTLKLMGLLIGVRSQVVRYALGEDPQGILVELYRMKHNIQTSEHPQALFEEPLSEINVWIARLEADLGGSLSKKQAQLIKKENQCSKKADEVALNPEPPSVEAVLAALGEKERKGPKKIQSQQNKKNLGHRLPKQAPQNTAFSKKTQALTILIKNSLVAVPIQGRTEILGETDQKEPLGFKPVLSKKDKKNLRKREKLEKIQEPREKPVVKLPEKVPKEESAEKMSMVRMEKSELVPQVPKSTEAEVPSVPNLALTEKKQEPEDTERKTEVLDRPSSPPKKPLLMHFNSTKKRDMSMPSKQKDMSEFLQLIFKKMMDVWTLDAAKVPEQINRNRYQQSLLANQFNALYDVFGMTGCQPDALLGQDPILYWNSAKENALFHTAMAAYWIMREGLYLQRDDFFGLDATLRTKNVLRGEYECQRHLLLALTAFEAMDRGHQGVAHCVQAVLQLSSQLRLDGYTVLFSRTNLEPRDYVWEIRKLDAANCNLNACPTMEELNGIHQCTAERMRDVGIWPPIDVPVVSNNRYKK